jgi:hypothetical protein
VIGFEDAPIQAHRLLHVDAELRVELAEQGRCERLQHARMRIDRSGSHEQARRRRDLVEDAVLVGQRRERRQCGGHARDVSRARTP